MDTFAGLEIGRRKGGHGAARADPVIVTVFVSKASVGSTSKSVS